MPDDSLFQPLGPPPLTGPPSHVVPGDNGSMFVPLNNKPVLSTSFKKLPTAEGGDGSVWGDITHGVGLGTRNVIEGVTGLPTTLLDAATSPGRWLERQFGLPVGTPPSDIVRKTMDAAGLPTPQTDAEKQRAEIVRGGAAMLTPMGMSAAAPKVVGALPAAVRPFVSMPGATSLPQAAGQVVAGAAGAGLGDITASSDYVPEWAKPTAHLAGTMLGAGTVGSLYGALGTLKNAITGNESDIAGALARLGITPRTAAAVTTSPTVQQAEAAFTKAPLSGAILQPRQRQTVDEFGQAVENTASKLGVSTTADEAGRAAQAHIRDWRDNTFPAMEDKAWAPVNATMKTAGDVVDPAGYRAALQRAAADVRLANMPETQKTFASGQIQKWLDALDADAPAGKMLSWDEAQAIKQRIGDAMGTPDLVASIGDKAMKGLYGGLANDMKASAALAGKGQEYDVANAFSTAGRTFINKTLSKAISGSNVLKEEISGDQAARSLAGGDATDLRTLRLLIPKAADELAAWKLRDMANARPSQQTGSASPDTSTGTFLTNYWQQKLARPAGTAALFDADPEVGQNVSDLVKVAGHLRSMEKSLNTSGTSGASAWLSLIPQIMGAYHFGGPRAALGLLAGEIGAPIAVGKALTNPAVINLMSAERGQRLPYTGRVAGVLGDITQPQP